jgi:hypothetical protein
VLTCACQGEFKRLEIEPFKLRRRIEACHAERLTVEQGDGRLRQRQCRFHSPRSLLSARIAVVLLLRPNEQI